MVLVIWFRWPNWKTNPRTWAGIPVINTGCNRYKWACRWFLGLYCHRDLLLHIFWSNYSDLTRPGPPKCSWVREISLFQGNLGCWNNCSIWPDIYLVTLVAHLGPPSFFLCLGVLPSLVAGRRKKTWKALDAKGVSWSLPISQMRNDLHVWNIYLHWP